MDYKDTLNLPRTSFPMKANLPNREPNYLARWEQEDLYHRLRKDAEGRTKYILHDGPPYANGNIHMGTALNKILKDIIVKSHQMNGFDAVYVPGWDCHGLPIEHQVDKKLGKKKREMTQVEVRKACREYAARFIDVQRDEFKRLGILGDWADPYLTMKYQYEAITAGEFAKFYQNGSVYHSEKPIYWCNSCRTALAEAEVEYADHKSPSIFVAFSLIDDLSAKYPELEGLETSLVIWTTTPWTIPANLAVAVHPEFEYVAVRHGNKAYILAKRLAAVCMDTFGLQGWEVAADIDPMDIEGIKAKHPLYDRESVGVLADYVTLESGTGLVHTAPGHGREDYETGVRYGLPPYSPVDSGGRFTKDVGFFAGMKVEAANPEVIAKLEEAGALLAKEEISHSYPHCWRCKKPVIYRATPQWFISMKENGLRDKALKCIEEDVRFVPKWGQARIHGMIENRPDWCISRQRAWGVPIIVFTCESCGESFLTEEMSAKVIKRFEQEGADAWFAHDVKELIGDDACPNCGEKLSKERDILDVWFDSGTSHAAVVEPHPDMPWPADLYLEGSDQHRGWFHSSLLCSVGARGSAPYKMVLTHGYVVDGDGRKMSKSLGNVIKPAKIIQQYGAEILRLWVAAEDYTDDIRISPEFLKQLSEAYRRIRNTMRFLLGNLNGFDPNSDKIDLDDMTELDRVALHQLEVTKRKLAQAYEDFAFHSFYHTLHNYCVVDLSGFYLDVIKDRLYTAAPRSRARRAAQTVLYEILSALVRLMAPVMSFTAEELWDQVPTFKAEADSVHLAQFAPADDGFLNQELAERWKTLLGVRAEVNKALDQARKDKLVGNSLDAFCTIDAPGELGEFLAKYAASLEEITMVSRQELARIDGAPEGEGLVFESKEIEGLKVAITRSDWEKCPRCWKRRAEVGTEGNEICHGCAEALKEAGA